MKVIINKKSKLKKNKQMIMEIYKKLGKNEQNIIFYLKGIHNLKRNIRKLIMKIKLVNS